MPVNTTPLTAANTRTSADRLRVLGWCCVASGALGVVVGLFTMGYPPAVPDTQWSYPFTVGVQWSISILLALVHLLTLAGLVGVCIADPHRGSRVGRLAVSVAIAGYVVLAVAEVLSGAIGSEATTSGAAVSVGTVFGVASILLAAGSVVAGVTIVRARFWHGLGAWMLLASGLIVVLFVLPGTVLGIGLLRNVSLVVWSLTFIPLGLAVARSARSCPQTSS